MTSQPVASVLRARHSISGPLIPHDPTGSRDPLYSCQLTATADSSGLKPEKMSDMKVNRIW